MKARNATLCENKLVKYRDTLIKASKEEREAAVLKIYLFKINEINYLLTENISIN